MQLKPISSDVAHAALRALKTIAIADGEMHDLERRMISSAQQHITHTDFDLDALTPITPSELANAVTSTEERERIISACVIVALIDGEISPLELPALDAFASALDVKSRALVDVRHMVDEHLLVLRVDIARRSFLGQRGRAYLAEYGVRGFGRTVLSLMGVENTRLAARYRALQDLPRGTLGREYYEFVRKNGFALPGEPNGAPEPVIFHDCLHVLAGYQTSNIEETQIASFQAGMLKRDAVFGLLFMLAQFHLGVQITPITGAEKLVADPDLMLRAFVRGTMVNRDMCTEWDPTLDFERTLEELRVAYNIVPREQPVAA